MGRGGTQATSLSTGLSPGPPPGPHRPISLGAGQVTTHVGVEGCAAPTLSQGLPSGPHPVATALPPSARPNEAHQGVLCLKQFPNQTLGC